jgi:hypothetical protein
VGFCFRVDEYSVPDVARGEFEVAMRRTMHVIEKLPGFLVHAVVEKNGASEFNIATLVAWESRQALDGAAVKMRGYRDELGFDLQSTLTRWRIRTAARIVSAPP